MKIIVVGEPKEGKTSFVYLISNMLREKGFKVDPIDSDIEEYEHYLSTNIDRIMKSLKKQFKNKTIEIEIQQVRRKG